MEQALTQTSLSVYLIHWNAPDWCAASVKSVSESTVDTRITVIDNGGGPVPLPSGVRVLSQATNRGYTGGANTALSEWAGRDEEWCVVASHDLHVEPDALSEMLACGEAYPEAGIVGPYYTMLGPRGGAVLKRLDGIEEKEWISGTCLMIRRACFDSVGFFDERFGSYVEDADYCLRARDRGWSVMAVSSARAHGLGCALGARARLEMYANGVFLEGKRHGRSAAIKALFRQVVLAGWHLREALRSGGNARYELRAARDRLAAVRVAIGRAGRWRRARTTV